MDEKEGEFERQATAGRDSGKHALSVVEGAVRSGRRKGEGFGERGRHVVREVGIYRLGWWSKVIQKSIFYCCFFKCVSRWSWQAFFMYLLRFEVHWEVLF